MTRYNYFIRQFFFFFGPLLFSGISFLQAQPIKVFSRYNYYLPGDQGSVAAVLPDSLPAAGYRLVLFRDGQVLATAEKAENHLLTAAIDLRQLPLGSTKLTYRVMQDQRIGEEGVVEIVRLAPRPNAVQLDRLTGGLIADGLPFFPFGFYCVPVGDLPEREVVHGFNMIGPYQNNLPADRAERMAYMDRCAQIGMRVQYSVNSLIGSGHNGAKGFGMPDEEKLSLLKAEIIAFRDHPALLSWYINDEPDGQGRPPAILEAAYKLIHELDPYHPVSIVFMMPAKADEFRHTMDIAMTDPYPIPGPANKVMEDVKKYAEAYRYEKSVWLVPQAFGGQEMWAREPTAQEIRLMTYMGLVSGAKGIQYYVHAPGNINPQSVSAWSACSDIAVETAQMTSFLLSADPAPFVHSDDTCVLTRAFRYKGNLLVIAVNNENKPKPLSLHVTIADTAISRQAELWFENRTTPFEAGELHDIIDAYGTRVYLVRATNASAATGIAAGNLTLNPSFEKIVSPGLPIGSNTTHTSRQKADIGATFFADPRQSVDGMFSLRLITPTDSGGDKIRLVPLIMNKGDSYTASIWAKSKKQDKMPSFRLSMDAMGETHTYTLTGEWEKYGFTFTAPASSANVLLSLDLITQGTAWFDLLQVSPDPIIQYRINADHTAAVTIASQMDHTQLRYAIDKEPDEGSALYRQPVIVKKAAHIYAGVFRDKQQVAASSIFVPVNRAQGMPVKLSAPADPHYAAAGEASLTDGMMGTTAFKDGRWLGFNGTNLDATIDLQEATTVNAVTASFLCDPNSGIFLPPLVSVYTSADGQRFELAGEKPNGAGNIKGEPYLQKVTLPVKRKGVRYIRVVARGFGTIPDGYLFKGSMGWLFTDEILVE